MYRERVLEEIDALPKEYLPLVLQLVQTFREGVMLKSQDEQAQQTQKPQAEPDDGSTDAAGASLDDRS